MRGWTGFGLMSHTDRHHTLLAHTFLYSNFSLFCVVKNYDWLDRQQWILTDWHENFFSLSNHKGMETVSMCWACPQMEKFTFLTVTAQWGQGRRPDCVICTVLMDLELYHHKLKQHNKSQHAVYYEYYERKRDRWILVCFVLLIRFVSKEYKINCFCRICVFSCGHDKSIKLCLMTGTWMQLCLPACGNTFHPLGKKIVTVLSGANQVLLLVSSV